MEYTATDLKKNSGEVLDTAQREPVKILKHGREYAAVISIQDYEILEQTKKHSELKKSVQAGFDQIGQGEFSTRSVDEIFEEVLKNRGIKKSVS